MATTKEIGAEWNVKANTVAEYCASGLVPGADKVDGKWVIPAGTPKPMCTSYKAAQYLIYLRNIEEGASPNILLICSDQKTNIDCIEYLSNIGFCSSVKWVNSNDGQIDFENSLRGVKVTDSGINLILKEQNKKKNSHGLTIGAYAELNVKNVKAGINVKKEF